jgi:hypothetical protein
MGTLKFVQSADTIPLQRIAMSKYVSDLTTVVRVRRLTRLALTSAVSIVFAIHTTIFSLGVLPVTEPMAVARHRR